MALKARVEAIIYAAEEPVTVEQIAALLKEEVLAEELRLKVEAELAAADEARSEGQPAEDSAEFVVVETEAVAEIEAAPVESAAADETAEVSPVEETAEATPAEAEEPAAEVCAESETPAEPMTKAPLEVETEAPVNEESSAAASDESAPEEVAAELAENAGASAENAEAAVAAPETSAAKRTTKKEPSEDARVRAVIREIVRELVTEYASEERGIEIKAVAGGFRMATKPEHHDIIRAFSKSLKPPVKLSLAALETLAVIAYKQPVTVPEISEIRGVESGGVIATLLDRKLISTGGRKQVVGRPILYKTSKEFLLRFGLNNVSDLPSMDEFEKLASEVQADLIAEPDDEQTENRSLNFNKPYEEDASEMPPEVSDAEAEAVADVRAEENAEVSAKTDSEQSENERAETTSMDEETVSEDVAAEVNAESEDAESSSKGEAGESES